MKQAIMILHEIYGVNHFIEDMCQTYKENGFDVFCPNFIQRSPFSYEQSEEAYRHFMSKVGFDIYQQIERKVDQLKSTYDKVFILGFSVGATIAWRCCENSGCDGIIGCYGSRIRDYVDLNPNIPTLLLFSKEVSFDVPLLISKLKNKRLLQTYQFSASHGFLDLYSKSYDMQASCNAMQLISDFIMSR